MKPDRSNSLALLVIALAFAFAASVAGDVAALDFGQVSAHKKGRRAMGFVLQTKAFASGAEIPAKYTCSGENVSPALSWNGAPQGTKSFALIVDDPDAPSGTFTHWLVYDLPVTTLQLPENVSPADDLSGGGRQGRNDFRRVGYGGPCPPPGKAHRYFFRLYALNSQLNLPAGAPRREVENALRGHILAQAEIMAKFAR
ncbi:MAG TPA: YbhB/YbcL family Raf kinase inhibitor-like protein [Terriglobales bacterium]|nr:YbhB/YbcL family Raf kinase inhibitor-like protein [Terriglobales bacterium]